MAFIVIRADREHVSIIENEDELDDRMQDGSLQSGDIVYRGELYGFIEEIRKLAIVLKGKEVSG